MTRAGGSGFTVLEVLLALSIVATMLVILFSGVGVGLKAWRQGEARAEALEYQRGLAARLARPLEGAFPYLGPAGRSGRREILFKGESERVSFVTTAPPVPFSPSIAFTAVTFEIEGREKLAFAIREKVLPNLDPFEATGAPTVDSGVTSVRFRYLRGPGRPWQDQWDASQERALPQAVEIAVNTAVKGPLRPEPPIVVMIRTTMP